ncbi:MAG: class I SAM-dependent methyltransferase [bacterium]
MAWYKEWFGQDYLKVYPHRDEKEARRQIDFIERNIDLSGRKMILDLGCGSGRHAQEMSRRGLQVTCLDLSTVLLKLAKEKNTGAACCSRFVRADMRYIPFRQAFDVVVSFFTTFGYFKKDEENLQTLKSIEEVLKPGGQFLLDYLNKSHVIENLVPFDSRRDNGFEVTQERHYNRSEERIEKKITLKENGNEREYYESVRLYTLDEMKSLLAKTNLQLQKIFGDFDGSAFSSQSPRLILIGQREP